MINQKILKNLICPNCQSEIDYFKNELICRKCKKTYSMKENIPYLIEKPGQHLDESSSDILINKLKVFFKKYPTLFNIFYYSFGVSFVGKSAQKAIENLDENKIILNLGSGVKIIRKDVINVDFYPFLNVDVLADITKLPFKENSVDGVICESVLEHVKDPQKVLQEIKRILKPRGLIYLTVPFVANFHSSPNDYYRWSKFGLRELMQSQGFKEKEISLMYGPTSALLSVMNEWLATVFSFGLISLQQILLIVLTIITFPLKFLDYLIYKFPTSQNIAFGFYYLGEKSRL